MTHTYDALSFKILSPEFQRNSFVTLCAPNIFTRGKALTPRRLIGIWNTGIEQGIRHNTSVAEEILPYSWKGSGSQCQQAGGWLQDWVMRITALVQIPHKQVSVYPKLMPSN